MNWLLRLIPKDKRELVELGQRLVANLDTKEERQRVVEYAREMLVDGRIEVSEWSKFGKVLNIFKHEPPRRKRISRD